MPALADAALGALVGLGLAVVVATVATVAGLVARGMCRRARRRLLRRQWWQWRVLGYGTGVPPPGWDTDELTDRDKEDAW